MRVIQLSLFDLLAAPRRLLAPAPPKAPPRAARSRREGAAAQRYAHMTRELLSIHGVRVRKWRTSMSGVAWMVEYRDATRSRLIEAPRPRGPMSAAVFCHEIGHHAIGLGRYAPRCLEEYHAWMWGLDAMRNYDITITQRVRDRVHDSLHYAIQKAQRRGLKHLPGELAPFSEPRRSG